MATVLIIEDETPILVLADSVLESAGYRTITAATLAEAEALISSDTQFDIVFTDVHLGEHHEGGVRVGRLVQQLRPGIPVLYTSGRNLTDGLKELLVEPGAFLSKPYTDKDLLEAIAQLLRR